MLAATAATELERTASAYRDAAAVLRRMPERVSDYTAELENAQQVHWDSRAGDAFRQAAAALHHPGNFFRVEAEHLSGIAATIAADLSSYAEAARQLSSMVVMLSSTDISALAEQLGVTGLESLSGAASEALFDASTLVQFLEDHGGIPRVLREAASRLW